ncbi:LysR family transcriptional regulator [Spongorhabdus nitratireducens]
MLLEDLQVVLRVAEFRSITAAAASLDMRTATASAAIKRVEKALGVDLFIRTTRHLKLSGAGEKYLPSCEQALMMLERARQNVRDDLDNVDGELRIALSSDLGRNLAMPWLDEFMETYPSVSLRSHISDSNIDFYRDSVDMALRYGSPGDASLYGFKICNVPIVLCATEDYLAQNGTPQHPHDLASHNGLFYQLHDILHDVWKFSDGSTEYKVKMTGNRASNDGDLVRRWCVSGKGLAIKSSLDMAADLLAGRVVNVMPDFQPPQTELWLICPGRQSITPAVRLLREHFKAKCSDILQQLTQQGIIKNPANNC